MKTKRSASMSLQKIWTPNNFRIDEEFGCLTNAERLENANPKLKLEVGRTRIFGHKKWGEHAWCVTGKGHIIDPYFLWCFPNQWHLIEYVVDHNVFGGYLA